MKDIEDIRHLNIPQIVHIYHINTPPQVLQQFEKIQKENQRRKNSHFLMVGTNPHKRVNSINPNKEKILKNPINSIHKSRKPHQRQNKIITRHNMNRATWSRVNLTAEQ